MSNIWQGLGWLLGLGEEKLSVSQMALRAGIVYVAAILIVRLGEKRFMGKSTTFDVILGIVFGSVMSRAITGNAPFFPALAAGFVLVCLHWVFAALAFHSDSFGTLVKGRSRLLVRDGQLLWNNMRESHASEKDLKEAMRLKGIHPDLSEVESAHFERSGDISVVRQRRSPEILEVSVEDGVQVVRIRLE